MDSKSKDVRSQPTRIPKPSISSQQQPLVSLKALAHQAHWDKTFDWLLEEIHKRAGDEEFEVHQSVWIRPDLNLYELTDFIMQETEQVVSGRCVSFPAPLSDFLTRYQLRAVWKWTSLSEWSIVFSWRHLRVKNTTDVIEDVVFAKKLDAAQQLHQSIERWTRMLEWMERRILELAKAHKTQLVIPEVTWNRTDLDLPEVARAIHQLAASNQLEGGVEALGIPQLIQFAASHAPAKFLYSVTSLGATVNGEGVLEEMKWHIRAEWPSLASTSSTSEDTGNPSTPPASA